MEHKELLGFIIHLFRIDRGLLLEECARLMRRQRVKITDDRLFSIECGAFEATAREIAALETIFGLSAGAILARVAQNATCVHPLEKV